jgi:hypothetical protein
MSRETTQPDDGATYLRVWVCVCVCVSMCVHRFVYSRLYCSCVCVCVYSFGESSAIWTTLLFGCLAAFVYAAADCISLYVGQVTEQHRWSTVSSGLLSSFGLSSTASSSSKAHPGTKRRSEDASSGIGGGAFPVLVTASEGLTAVTVCNLNPLR